MKAVRYTFTEPDYDRSTDGYIVLSDDLYEVLRKSDGWGKLNALDKSQIEIVTFTEFLESLDVERSDNSSPSISFIYYHSDEDMYRAYSSVWTVETLINEYLGLEPEYLIPGIDTIFKHVINDDEYYFYDGPDCGGYDVEPKLVIIRRE